MVATPLLFILPFPALCVVGMNSKAVDKALGAQN